jgi:hypothetical protein
VKPEPVKVVKPELTLLEKILKVENLQLIIEKRAKLVQTPGVNKVIDFPKSSFDASISEVGNKIRL